MTLPRKHDILKILTTASPEPTKQAYHKLKN